MSEEILHSDDEFQQKSRSKIREEKVESMQQLLKVLEQSKQQQFKNQYQFRKDQVRKRKKEIFEKIKISKSGLPGHKKDFISVATSLEHFTKFQLLPTIRESSNIQQLKDDLIKQKQKESENLLSTMGFNQRTKSLQTLQASIQNSQIDIFQKQKKSISQRNEIPPWNYVKTDNEYFDSNKIYQVPEKKTNYYLQGKFSINENIPLSTQQSGLDTIQRTYQNSSILSDEYKQFFKNQDSNCYTQRNKSSYQQNQINFWKPFHGISKKIDLFQKPESDLFHIKIRPKQIRNFTQTFLPTDTHGYDFKIRNQQLAKSQVKLQTLSKNFDISRI